MVKPVRPRPPLGTNDSIAAWTRELVRLLIDEAEQPAFLRALSIVPDELWRPDGRLPYASICAVWSRLTDGHADPAFGLDFVARQDVATLGVSGYLAMASPTGLDAITRVIRYQRLHKSELELSIDERARQVRVVDRPPPGVQRWPRHLAEAILGAVVSFLRRWSSVTITPVEATFQHEASADAVAAVHRVLGCPVRFGAPLNQLTLRLDELLAPLKAGDAQLASYLELLAEKMVAELPPRDALVSSAQRAVAELLPSGDVALPLVARRLALGPRTLQRRLREVGLSFQTLVEEVRRDAAHRLLRDPTLNVNEVAFLLGFSDTSSFRRARRRWSRCELLS
jgi:AraC-like DNA-binding protein